MHLPIPRRVVAKSVQRKIVGVAEDRLPKRVKAVLDVLTRRVPFLSTAAATTTSFLDSGPKARTDRFLSWFGNPSVLSLFLRNSDDTSPLLIHRLSFP